MKYAEDEVFAYHFSFLEIGVPADDVTVLGTSAFRVVHSGVLLIAPVFPSVGPLSASVAS